MGWENNFKWKNLDLQFFLRGVFGHQLVNSVRLFYENPNVSNSYNVVQTKYYDASVSSFPRYSSTHVENASFLRLDYLTLGYLLKLKSSKSLRLYLNTQNLFTITGYTGLDPEARVDERIRNNSQTNGQSYPNVLVSGVDDRITYFPIKSFTFGLQLEL